MNEQMEVIFGGYIGITDGKITSISKTPPKEHPKEIIDAAGMIAMPGLINCHTELANTLLRNYMDDLPNKEALEQLLQKEAVMNSRIAKDSALLGIAECLRFGVTSVSDLYYYPDATAEAADQAGIKANLALSSYRFIDENEDFDFETDEQCQALKKTVEKWNGHDSGRIKIDAGIYAEYTSNYRLWEGLSSYALDAGLGMQFRLAQTKNETESCLERTGLPQAELLDCHGMFSVPATVIGCTYLSDEEKRLMGRRKASAVATPRASAKSGEVILPVQDCVKAGINVALGSGSVIDCGNTDLFEEMRSLASQARQAAGSSDAMPASAVLMMATVCGAKAQRRQGECGMLKPGMDADLILVDFTAPHLMPCHNVLSGLVFSAKGTDVAMTMVRGKILYQSGKFTTIDLNAVVKELMEYAIPQLFQKSSD